MFKRIFWHSFNLLFGLLSKNKSFVRLSFSLRGKIRFFDKNKKKIITIHSRGESDSVTADLILRDGGYDLQFLRRYHEIVTIYADIVKEGKKPIILDCGANCGIATLFFATLFPDATVIAIEPSDDNLEAARRNCRHLVNVKFEHAAIGAMSGRTEILDKSAHHNSFQMSPPSPTGEIQIKTIPDILSTEEDGVIFIVKVDIEGFENNLFSENLDWLDDTPLLIVETHDWMLPKEANSRRLLMALAQRDRDFLHRGENIYSILN